MKEGDDDMEERTEKAGRWRKGKRDRERNGGRETGRVGGTDGGKRILIRE
jgi:hypothetical protein